MPDYQRVRVRSLRTRIWPPFWNLFCPACGQVGSDLSNNRALALDEAREHWATCPALRLQRLLADLEAFARSSEVISGECRAEATQYSAEHPEFTHWQTWSYAHHAYATHVTHFVEKYREAPDA